MVPIRLKSARLRVKLTQEQLGVLAGIDESTARSRISQYENGTYTPTFLTVCAMARVLNVPECYFYILDDKFAERVCSGQQKLATALEFFQNNLSDSFGVKPPLY